MIIHRTSMTRTPPFHLVRELDVDNRTKILSRKQTLFGRIHLKNRLSDTLGIKADLSDRKMLRPDALERAQRESVLLF